MTTKTKKKAAEKKTQHRLQEANDRIAELESQAELGGSRLLDARSERDEAIEESTKYQLLYSDGRSRIRKLENHILDLRSIMDDQWAQLDLLRRTLAGSEMIARGVTARQAVRQAIKLESMEIVPNKARDRAGED